MSIPYVYDAGVLIAIDDDDRRMWAIHHLALEEGRQLIVPAIVIAQAWRNSRRQVLGRFIQSCDVVPIGLDIAKSAGLLCRQAGTKDAVDATVVVMALARGAIVFTSDPDDIAQLSSSAGVKPGLVIRPV